MSSSDSADQRKRRAVQQSTGLNKLPWRIVAHCCAFLDSKSLSRAQSANRNLRSLPLDTLWRACYQREFEEESMDDASIATEGEQTSWKKRWMNRARVESNRRERFSRRSLSLALRNEQLPSVRGATASLIVCHFYRSSDTFIGAFSCSSGEERWRVAIAADDLVRAVIIEGREP